MAKHKKITPLFVEQQRPPKTGRVDWVDTVERGFGLRISASGTKTWSVVCRVKGGVLVRKTLGTVADIPNVEDARRMAQAFKEMARAGIDPRVKAEQPATNTFAAVADRFVTEHIERNLRPKTASERRRIIGSDLKPRWGTRPIRDITRGDVTALLDTKAMTRPKQADEIRKLLRTLFKWAMDRELVTSDPTEVSKRAQYNPRDRALSDDEIKLFWDGCDRLGYPFGPIFKLMLVTGQREGEVGGMARSEIDLEKKVWTLPAGRTKNGKAHIVHLSTLAIAVLKTVPNTGELLFASRSANPPSGYSKAKARLDAYTGETPPWVLHDLRRTAATGMARLGIAPHVVDRILNHTAGTIRGVAAIYNRFQYEKEREAALEAWGRYLETLMGGGDANVVPLRA